MLEMYASGSPTSAIAYQTIPTRHLMTCFSKAATPARPATTPVTTNAPIVGPRSPGVVRTGLSGMGNAIKKTITYVHVQANATTT